MTNIWKVLEWRIRRGFERCIVERKGKDERKGQGKKLGEKAEARKRGERKE